MLTQLAIAGYRSIRDLTLGLRPLNVITGANGSGKSSLYRALRLLSETAQGRLVASLAQEGGLASVLWAGPEQISRSMRAGEHPVQGTRRAAVISLKLGFTTDDFGYAVDLGLPVGGPFPLDPEIKVEAMWAGQTARPANMFAERRGPTVRLRRHATGNWRRLATLLAPYDSMVTHCADPEDGLELLRMRDRMRNWRFYDSLRTDREAPARRPHVLTYTPVLASDGGDLAAALTTIRAIGDAHGLAEAIDDAFPGATLEIGGGDHAGLGMRQTGLLRPMAAAELSDGTLRYLLLIAALMSPRPPEIMVLNEPEASLHPQLLEPLARLLIKAAGQCQIVVVSHSHPLVETLRQDEAVATFRLEKDFGETRVDQAGDARWAWPVR